MAKKKKAAKKTAAAEAPPEEEPEDDQEPETPDPFAEDAEPPAPEPEEPTSDEADKAEAAPKAPAESVPTSRVEQAAAEAGEKPLVDDSWKSRQRILDLLQTNGRTIEDVASANYYEMRGVTVLTMNDGRKVDVTD